MKEIIIHLVGGKAFRVSLNDVAPGIPVGLPTDHDIVLQVLQAIASSGFQDPENSSAWIPPGQITKVECVAEVKPLIIQA